MGDRVEEHFLLFNEAVRRGDWTEFMATFTPDAVMTFEGVPAGPYTGREAIAAAYTERPPTDTMSCVSDERDGDHDVVRFAWDAGGGGTMRVTWHDGAVTSVAVTFDRLPFPGFRPRRGRRASLPAGPCGRSSARPGGRPGAAGARHR